MPEVCRDDGHERQAKLRLAQARKNPEQHTETGGDAEAVEQQIVCGGLGAAISQERTIGKHIRLMKRHDGNQRQREPGDKPERRTAEEREQRHAARGVNPAREDARPTRNFKLVVRSVHSKALGFAGAAGAGSLAFC